MIVRHFLHWVRTAPAGERAEATSALARAYLYSDLSTDDRAAAEGAMIMLLDDPSPLVRRALAEVFAGERGRAAGGRARARRRSAGRRRAGAAALAAACSMPIWSMRSRPGEPQRQAAIASARRLPCAVSAAIAEVGCAEACLLLLENGDAEIAPFSLDRIVAAPRPSRRHPRSAAVARRPAGADAPGAGRQAVGDARRLRRRPRHGSTRIARAAIAREACEKATVALAAESPRRRSAAARSAICARAASSTPA